MERAERRVMDELGRRAAEEEPPEEGHLEGPAAEREAPATPVALNEDMMEKGGDVVMRLMGPAKVTELYSPPRVIAILPRSGLVAGSTFDLHVDEAGVA